MNTIKLINNNYSFVGDIHGEWADLYKKIKNYKITDYSLILCGDIGIGFDNPFYTKKLLKYFNNLFKNKNIHIYAFRGNHDDPLYFSEDNMNITSNIHLLPDYTILEIDNDKILCIGGSISLDRNLRTLNKSYWSNEACYKNDDILKELNDITIVATHSSPTFTCPIIKRGLDHWAIKDEKLLKDVDEDRKTMDEIYKELVNNKNPLKKWYYGHYHKSNKENIHGVDFILLDIMEFSN